MIAIRNGSASTWRSQIYTQARTHSERKTVRRFLFWWSARLQIRTENRRNIRKRHCLRPVFIIIRENQPVVKYIDAVEEDIDDLSLVFLVVRIAIFKPADPLDNVLPTVFEMP